MATRSFTGILCLLDTPSDRAPRGTRGNRLLLPREVAHAALPSLAGRPINATHRLDGHDKERVVGEIRRGRIFRNRLLVQGFVHHDGDLLDQLGSQPDGSLGMSFEMENAHVEDTRAKTWRVTQTEFTGASVLLRAHAAYGKTRFRLWQ